MIKSYVINMSKDSDRLQSFKKQFDRLGLEYERIPGVDGHQMPETDYEAFKNARPRDHKKGWMRGQMGCLLSHRLAWEAIANGDQPVCAVFEDDLHISDGLQSLLRTDSWVPAGTDLIRLEPSTNRVRLGKHKLASFEERDFNTVLSTTWCTGAYLITREAAQRLVDVPPERHQPVDVMLYCVEEPVLSPPLNIAQCSPAPCIQDKFLNPDNQRFSSNIEHNEIKPGTGGVAPSRLSPKSIFGAGRRTLLNYQRVKYR
ncbi:MAG: glycosyltransferase family 25 protein [Pseudomonadota bacterium]|nr:glycosyltransferase family 25 protein [Pseudomonadota bacterium]